MGFRKLIREKEAYCKAKYAYLKKLVELPFPPAEFWIEPTNYCNLKCIMCPQRGEMTRKKGMMKLGTFKKIIDKISAWGPKINLYHSGEPLLHPDIFEMIKYAAENNCYVNLATNGTLLDKEKSLKLIDSGLDELRFSFDGASREVYEKIRVGASFENVNENILIFLEKKKIRKSKKPKVVIEIILMEETKKHIDSFLERFKILKVDEVRFRTLVDWAGKLKISEISKPEDSHYKLCCHPWFSVAILWNGLAVPCCYDFNALYIYGDVKINNFFDTWNSVKAKSLRELFVYKKVEEINLCRSCINAVSGKDNGDRLEKINNEVFLIMMEEHLRKSPRIEKRK